MSLPGNSSKILIIHRPQSNNKAKNKGKWMNKSKISNLFSKREEKPRIPKRKKLPLLKWKINMSFLMKINDGMKN